MGDTGNEISTNNPIEEDDRTLEKLIKKNERLQSLLVRAKGTITEYKTKIDSLESEQYQCHIKINEQQALINRLSLHEPPKSDAILEVCCRVRVQDGIYCYVKCQQGYYWLNENAFKSKANLPEVIDSNFTKKFVNDQILAVTQDYQEKCLKLTEKLSVCENKNSALQDIINEQRTLLEKMEKEAKKFKDSGLSSLISMSSTVFDTILNMILEDMLDSGKIAGIQKSVNGFLSVLTEGELSKAKEHIGVLLKSLLDTSKRLLHARNELKAQDQAWRATCNSLLHEKEELKSQISKLRADFTTKTEEFTAETAKLKANAENNYRELNAKLKDLENELAKGINAPYLKHVFLQFIFANDASVQERMLSVISTILSFSKEDTIRIREHRAPKGVLTKLLNWN